MTTDGGGLVSVDVPGYGGVRFASGTASGERHQDHFLVRLTSAGLPKPLCCRAPSGGRPAPLNGAARGGSS